jgi:hypothetical protein
MKNIPNIVVSAAFWGTIMFSFLEIYIIVPMLPATDVAELGNTMVLVEWVAAAIALYASYLKCERRPAGTSPYTATLWLPPIYVAAISWLTTRMWNAYFDWRASDVYEKFIAATNRTTLEEAVGRYGPPISIMLNWHLAAIALTAASMVYKLLANWKRSVASVDSLSRAITAVRAPSDARVA